MSRLREWGRRVVGIIRPGRTDADLEEELRLHVELAEADERRRAAAPEDALRVARRRAGGHVQAMEALRDQRGVPWMDDLVRDVRHGLRSLRRTPVFTSVALLTLALGIGANTAIFSIVHGVLLSPLGYPRPEQLVLLSSQFPVGGSVRTLSYPEYEEVRTQSRSFAAVGAFTVGGANTGGGSGSWAGEVNLSARGRPMRVRSAAVDDHLLGALGVQPIQGRLFRPGETDAMPDRPGLGGQPIAILSFELWQAAFAGEAIVGQHVDVDGRPHEILGIMPPGADLMDHRVEIWLPLGVHPAIRRIRTNHFLQVIGRLTAGVSIDAAEADLRALLERWTERTGARGHVPIAQPAAAGEHTIGLQPLQAAVVGSAGRAVLLLQTAVAVVLLIVCVNLANLVLARGESRRREFALRAALGARRGRLLRQLVTEGLLLGFAGGALGVWLAGIGLRALAGIYPESLPRTRDIAIDPPVLLFAVTVSLATAVLLGLAPAAQRRSRDLVDALRSTDRVGTEPRRVRHVLVAAEVALAVMLVAGAGLLLRTLFNLAGAEDGLDRSRLVTFSMTLPRATSYEGGRAGVYQRLLDAVRTTPGIERATAMTDLPFARFVQGYQTRIDRTAAATAQPIETIDYYQFVMSDYFETMRIRIVAGRGFAPADAISESRVAIVNETMAKRVWKDADPIGQRVRPNLSASMGTMANPWHTVIGIARDVKEAGVDHDAGTEIYLFGEQPAPPVDGTERPWRVYAPPTMHVALRTSQPPRVLAPVLARLVRELDPSVPIVRLREMDEVFAESIRRPRLLADLIGAFAGLALLLAAVGTYGVFACLVLERRREIAIRMALGASRSAVIGQVLSQGLRVTLAGVAIGLAGAVAGGRLLAAFLFGVQPADPSILAVVVLVIVGVAILACWVPAYRASRVDPNAVLRAE